MRAYSHTPHRLQTTLMPAQEAIVIELRRHGVSRLRDLRPVQPMQVSAEGKGFKPYVPGYLHLDYKYLPQMPDETHRRYLFVAIDRATL